MSDDKNKKQQPGDKGDKGGKPAHPQNKGQRPEGKGEKSKGAGSAGHAKKHDDTPDAASEPRIEPRLQTRFKTHVREQLGAQHGLKNPMAQPRIDKIILNVNMGRHLEGTKIPANVKTTVLDTINKVTGQKPIVLKAKKSVSNFKVREGLETAAMVTLRRDRMWHFLDRFINLAAPRIKDFRGLNDKSFDKQGNYAFGLTEQGVFPEINMADVTFTHGMNISIGFQRSSPKLSRFILQELGFPFVKPEEVKKR